MFVCCCRMGGGLGEGGLNIQPDRRLADDGKRLGLSESAMDVDSEERSDIFLYLYSRGGGLEGERSVLIALHRGLADL